MTNRDSSLLLDGYPSCAASDGDSRPAGKGVLPEDFPDRLDRLKKATGHTWIVFAQGSGRGAQAGAPVAQGNGALRGSHALPLLACLPDARRPADPRPRGLRRGLPGPPQAGPDAMPRLPIRHNRRTYPLVIGRRRTGIRPNPTTDRCRCAPTRPRTGGLWQTWRSTHVSGSSNDRELNERPATLGLAGRMSAGPAHQAGFACAVDTGTTIYGRQEKPKETEELRRDWTGTEGGEGRLQPRPRRRGPAAPPLHHAGQVRYQTSGCRSGGGPAAFGQSC